MATLQLTEVGPVRVPRPDRLRVIEYTDPHSVWCWGCEPMVRRLEVRYPDVAVEVRMGGLFEDFRPMREYWTRMSGGRWKESVLAFMGAVAAQHRMPMNPAAIVAEADDFDSTYPACLAVKAAEGQGETAGRRYLRRLREAFLVEGRAIHRQNVQREVVVEAKLDVARFAAALEDGTAERAFRRDLTECRSEGITGFPSFVCRRSNDVFRVEGWQPWQAFEQALREFEPSLSPKPLGAGEASVLDLLRRYGGCATMEVSAVFGLTEDDADLLLEDLEARGRIVRRAAGSGVLWLAADAAEV